MFDHICGSSVPPYSSSILNTVAAAVSRFFTMLAVTGFLMALAGTARLGVIVPPGASSHNVANCFEPRYWITARDAFVDFSNIATSPEDWSSFAYLLPEGAGKAK